MKRIVLERLANCKEQYRVETNRLFGFIPTKWHTCLFFDAEREMYFDAVFSTLEEAYAFAEIERKDSSTKIVARVVIY